MEGKQFNYSEALFNQVFDQMPVGIVITDTENNIQHTNATALNWVKSATKTQILYHWLSPKTAAAAAEIAATMAATNDPTTVKSCSWELLATHNRIYEVRASLLKSDNEKKLILWVISDVSQQQDMAVALQRKTQELEESNKELEQFAYIVSHDLKEPVRMMSSYIQLLERRYKDKLDETALEFMHFVVDGASRIRQMLDDLLAYSRAGRDTRATEFANIQDIVVIATNNLRGRISAKQAKIDVKTALELPELYCNRHQLISVMESLLSNALKFCEVTPHIEIRVWKEEGNIVFSVQDNGIGITEQNYEAVFYIFKKLHGRNKYEGAGMGLSIVKRIVHAHRGKVWLTSQEKVGSTFFVSLPVITKEQISAMENENAINFYS